MSYSDVELKPFGSLQDADSVCEKVFRLKRMKSRMRHLISGFVILSFLLLCAGGCQDRSEKLCWADGTEPKIAVSACGEVCERGNAEACDRQVTVANAYCFKKKDREICRWMCDYATRGQDLYCKAHKALKSKAPATP